MTPTAAMRRIAATIAVVTLPLTFAGIAAARTPADAALPASAPVGECTGLDPAAVADLSIPEAAAAVPDLSTLVEAVTAAGLVETLSGEGPFTIFAPTNAAFEAIPTNVFDSLLADLDLLTGILSYHVVADEVTPDELAAETTLETLNGPLSIAPTEGGFLLDGGVAATTCAGIPVGNGIVYVIDAVLQPTEGVCPPSSSTPGSSVPTGSMPTGGMPASSTPGSSVPAC